jgi:F-type H+-transporting ATPase subunit a
VQISPDATILWQSGFWKLNATILVTWLNMAILVAGSAAVTRRLSTGEKRGRWQNLLEALVEGMEKQVGDMGLRPARDFLPFLGSLFLFILVSNLLSVVPGYPPPTGSLSTTAGLAACVFVAVPVWGIRRRGLRGYLALYAKPSIFMLPFNLIGELSRTLAMAVRLFGNVMSATMIAGILLTVAPLLFPVLMNALGLITGVIQAYIFAVLAAVYIAAATRTHEEQEKQPQEGGSPHG